MPGLFAFPEFKTFRTFLHLCKSLFYVCGGFTLGENMAYVCGEIKFMVVGHFYFVGVNMRFVSEHIKF